MCCTVQDRTTCPSPCKGVLMMSFAITRFALGQLLFSINYIIVYKVK